MRFVKSRLPSHLAWSEVPRILGEQRDRQRVSSGARERPLPGASQCDSTDSQIARTARPHSVKPMTVLARIRGSVGVLYRFSPPPMKHETTMVYSTIESAIA